jgi:hypothetical protein
VLSSGPPRRCTIAIAGLEAGPGSPGVSLARALRGVEGVQERIVGLAAERDIPKLRSADLGLWSVAGAPAPVEGAPFLAALREIHGRSPVDVLLATRTPDVDALVRMEPELGALGIRTFLPTVPQLEYLRTAGRSRNRAFDGGRVEGEYAVAAVGDGKGGVVGVAALRKIKAEGEPQRWVGVAAREDVLRHTVHAFAEAASLRGPLDLDVARTSTGRYEVIRSEPRLPGWVHLFASSGPNLPWVMVRLAMGEALEPQRELPGGPLLVGGAWQAWMARG